MYICYSCEMMHMPLIIGTRGSALALVQANIAAAALKAKHPHLTIEIRTIETLGDTNQQPIPLDTVGKGWFTQEIESALLAGDIHLAVHSLKDMGTQMPAGLEIGAYLPREDARDALITKNNENLEALKQGALIGTDSARRQVQMLALRSDVQMRSLRGNVPTRIEKLRTQQYDGIILAVAGLKRLGREKEISRYFSVEEMTPAPGQGTMAVQYALENTEVRDMLASINDQNTAHVSEIERTFSSAIGGGCKSPTGAYACLEGSDCVLAAMTTNVAGVIIRDTARAPWQSSADLGKQLADTMRSTLYAHARS